MLKQNPDLRFSAEKALQSEFFTETSTYTSKPLKYQDSIFGSIKSIEISDTEGKNQIRDSQNHQMCISSYNRSLNPFITAKTNTRVGLMRNGHGDSISTSTTKTHDLLINSILSLDRPINQQALLFHEHKKSSFYRFMGSKDVN